MNNNIYTYIYTCAYREDPKGLSKGGLLIRRVSIAMRMHQT